MTPQATTNIELSLYHRTGTYALVLPGRTVVHGTADDTLDTMRERAGLRNGYWLRSADLPGERVWTWVQL